MENEIKDEVKVTKKKTRKKYTRKTVSKQPPIAEFRTTEIQLVAYLRYKGVTVQAVNQVGPHKAEFVFQDVDRDLLDEFNSDNATVEPKMFANIMRQQTQAARRVTGQ